MRATKYTDDTRTKLLMCIEQGRTVKDACEVAGISDMTLTRWRRNFPDFNEAYLVALERQWRSIEGLKRVGVRTYKRDTERVREKAKEQAQDRKIKRAKEEAEESGKPLVYEGLRVRYGDIADDDPFTPCVNPRSMQVEYLKRREGRYVRFVLSVEVFKRRYPAYYRELVKQNSIYNVGD